MELRLTDTNAADDASGRVFGLNGNLYLPLVISAIGGLGGFAVLGYVFGLNAILAGSVSLVPFGLVLAWIIGLKRGRPDGYDRDKIEELILGRGFGPVASAQKEVMP
jgi:hypothetical protein